MIANRRTVARNLAAALALTPLLSRSGGAHPHEALQAEQHGHVEEQVVAMRAMLREAIAAKNAGKLRAIYAASFTHTHGSGKVDGRDARIVSVLAGDPVIETAPVEEMTMRVLHPDTAIVTGRSPILNKSENRADDFRWMQVWVRAGGEWQLAASQATRVAPTA